MRRSSIRAAAEAGGGAAEGGGVAAGGGVSAGGGVAVYCAIAGSEATSSSAWGTCDNLNIDTPFKARRDDQARAISWPLAGPHPLARTDSRSLSDCWNRWTGGTTEN